MESGLEPPRGRRPRRRGLVAVKALAVLAGGGRAAAVGQYALGA